MGNVCRWLCFTPKVLRAGVRVALNSHDPKLPQILRVVRHTRSAGNVARDAAETNDLQVIAIAVRDTDALTLCQGRRDRPAAAR